MKVLQINCSSFGSTGNIAKSIHNELLSQGHESRIFYGVGSTDDALIEPVGSMTDVHIHAVLSRYTGLQGYFSHIPTNKLIKKIKSYDPDVIHLHNLHGSYINLPILFNFLKKYNRKTIVTLHDCWLFTGKCPHFTTVGCEKWKENCGACPQLARYPRSIFIDRTKSNLKDKKKWFDGFNNLHIVAVSQWLKSVACESFLNEYPITAIPNGIDTDVFYPRESNRVREKYGIGKGHIILGVASVWTGKGLDEFVKIANMRPNSKIVLVGLTENESQGLPDNIIAIPRTENRDELAEIYTTADVFINLSLEETFGLVVGEAMACGTPAIVYNSTACPEIVADGTGFVAKPYNIEEIHQLIDKTEKDKLSSLCISHINENYTVKKMTDAYIKLYENIQKGGTICSRSKE